MKNKIEKINKAYGYERFAVAPENKNKVLVLDRSGVRESIMTVYKFKKYLKTS